MLGEGCSNAELFYTVYLKIYIHTSTVYWYSDRLTLTEIDIYLCGETQIYFYQTFLNFGNLCCYSN